MWGILIPIFAIVGSFAIPVTAIIMDYRRRRLHFEERRAMIERGMQPPPLQDEPFRVGRTPEEQRHRSLRIGLVLLFLGMGLTLASWLLGYVVTENFISPNLVGILAIGAAVVGFWGLGNLVYYAVSGKRGAQG